MSFEGMPGKSALLMTAGGGTPQLNVRIMNHKFLYFQIILISIFFSTVVLADDLEKEIAKIIYPNKSLCNFNELKSPSKQELSRIIPNLSLSKSLSYIQPYIRNNKNIDNLINWYRLFDFTEDGKSDLIYNGSMGGERLLLSFWEYRKGWGRVGDVH